MKRYLLLLAVIIFLTPAISVQGAERPLSGFSKALDDFYSNCDVEYTDDDLELLANVMYHENYWNGNYIMLLTGSVVLNRVKHNWFPDTIHDVLYQRGQYSTTRKFYTKTIPSEVYDLARRLLIFGSIAPDEVIFQAMFKQGSGVYYVENSEYFCYE